MNIYQVENIIAIYEEGSISKAAERLFITQSALNQQLLKLEKQLGAPLFVRGKQGLSPTEIGQVYLDGAMAMVGVKKNTYDKIRNMLNTKQNLLRVGLVTDRGQDMFTTIYSEFRKEHPLVSIEAIPTSTLEQIKMLRDRTMDIAYLCLESPPEEFNYTQVLQETILLAAPAAGILAPYADPHRAYSPIGDKLHLIENEKFILFSHKRTLRDAVDFVFEKEHLIANVASTMDSSVMLLEMVGKQGYYSMVPETYYTKRDDIIWFSLNSFPEWNMYATTGKTDALTSAGIDFINLSKQYWGARLKRIRDKTL
ncbi:MAG: LysR family transcriptional regulator [Lachnospiraceae bacterium]|nr:LysR family transcriptional regulator [Lachnospiraceae bacterium]